jgi:hypothetical protein
VSEFLSSQNLQRDLFTAGLRINHRPVGCTLFERTNRMLATSDIQKRKRELKARRKPLFERYEKNPNDTNLVLEIKIVDDQIAECNQQIERERIRRN